MAHQIVVKFNDFTIKVGKLEKSYKKKSELGYPKLRKLGTVLLSFTILIKAE